LVHPEDTKVTKNALFTAKGAKDAKAAQPSLCVVPPSFIRNSGFQRARSASDRTLNGWSLRRNVLRALRFFVVIAVDSFAPSW
jgi:hypothetical protein